MRRLTSGFVTVGIALVWAVGTAHAAPVISSATIEGSAADGYTIIVAARDPDAAVNAVHVAFGEGEGGFGESACRIGRDREPRGVGRPARFEVPFEPRLSGLHEIAVTVVSGACGGERRTTSVKLPLTVDLPGLPSVPDRDDPLLPPLPPLPPLLPLAAASAACADGDLVPSAENLARIRAATLCLINAERTARGLARLRTNRALRRAATRHSRDMISRRFFDHEGPQGPGLASRLKKVRYWPASASENIGAAQGAMATPDSMLDAWMHSTPHRANILHGAFRQAGLGIIAGTPQGGEGATYTVDFGRR